MSPLQDLLSDYKYDLEEFYREEDYLDEGITKEDIVEDLLNILDVAKVLDVRVQAAEKEAKSLRNLTQYLELFLEHGEKILDNEALCEKARNLREHLALKEIEFADRLVKALLQF